MLPERFTQEPYGLGFKKGTETQSFQNQINKVLQEMKDDGTLEKIRVKWMEEFVYGKDQSEN